MSRAVMRQALEALVVAWQQNPHWQITEAITALRAALMEPVVVQEPVVEIKPPNPEGATQCIVRWMAETPAGWVGAWDREALQQFVTPPRREWVSLTDADFDRICDNHSTLQGAARAIEAALKEKNA